MKYLLNGLYIVVIVGLALGAAPYILPKLPSLPSIPFVTEKYDPTTLAEDVYRQVSPKNDELKPKTLVWEVPRDTQSVVVEIYNQDNSYETYYTISNYISLKPGQKIKVIAK